MSRHENDSVPRRTIRFFADWGADSPLWENGTDNYLMYPEDLGLSGELATRLYGWAEFWCSHHQWETVWDAPASEEWSRKEGGRAGRVVAPGGRLLRGRQRRTLTLPRRRQQVLPVPGLEQRLREGLEGGGVDETLPVGGDLGGADDGSGAFLDDLDVGAGL